MRTHVTSVFLALILIALPAADIRRGLAQSASGIVIERTAGGPLVVSAERIAALPRQSETTKRKGTQGEESTEWSGPLLWDVLTADKAIDPDKHAEYVRMTLLIAGRDGYTVRIALAEIAPDFAGKPVLLADRMNGAPLPDGALQLIVPNEKRAGRSVRKPVRITIEHEKAAP